MILMTKEQAIFIVANPSLFNKEQVNLAVEFLATYGFKVN